MNRGGAIMKVETEKRLVFVTGERGIGKTTLIRDCYRHYCYLDFCDGNVDVKKLKKAFDTCTSGVVVECQRISDNDIIRSIRATGIEEAVLGCMTRGLVNRVCTSWYKCTVKDDAIVRSFYAVGDERYLNKTWKEIDAEWADISGLCCSDCIAVKSLTEVINRQRQEADVRLDPWNRIVDDMAIEVDSYHFLGDCEQYVVTIPCRYRMRKNEYVRFMEVINAFVEEFKDDVRKREGGSK